MLPIAHNRLIRTEMNDHLTRYHVPYMLPEPELFIDRERTTAYRAFRERPYEVYESGASPTGGAARIGTARTMADALAIVNRRLGRIERSALRLVAS